MSLQTSIRKIGASAPPDGFNDQDIKRIIPALRKVWSWSFSRRLVVKRCLLKNGFSKCEHCLKKCPKIFVDHIEAVGSFGVGYIERLFVPSSQLQGLCKNCHKEKTKIDLKRIKEAQEKDFF